MKKTSFFLIIALILIGSAQAMSHCDYLETCASRMPAVVKDADSFSICCLVSKGACAVQTGDAESMISLWDVDSIQYPYDKPMRVGRAEIWRAFAVELGRGEVEFELMQDEIVVAGIHAYVRGRFSYRAKAGAEGKESSLKGKFILICRRQADGTWRIYRESSNLDAI